MLKNLKKTFRALIAPVGIIALAAIIGFGLMGCDDGTTGNQDPTPAAGDFDISGLSQPAGSVTAVSITPKTGKSQGAITIYYAGTSGTTYAKSTTLPSTAGQYAVTFDVAAVTGWNAATGLIAGTLTISSGPGTPVAGDFDISGMSQITGHATDVSITPKAGKSQGTITIHYEGTNGTTYTKSTTHPTAAGDYTVTFDVAAATGWNVATGLSAGTLTIGAQTGPTEIPTADDFTITGLSQTVGSVSAVSITHKAGKSEGSITISYAGTNGTTYPKSTTHPTAAGQYAVTFDVAEALGWDEVTDLDAGILIIAGLPVADDFTITGLSQTVGSVTAVSITHKTDKSDGTITISYEGTNGTTYPKSTTHPTAAGEYTVTFDVAAATGWAAASNLDAGTLTISALVDYETGLSWGTEFTPLTLGLTPGNDTTEVNLNWYSSGGAAGKVAQVRFIKGTLSAGTELIEETGTVAAASTGYTQHKATVTGLEAGKSYQYSISNDGTDWSPMYDFKVATAGAFRFAVVADTQLTTGKVDNCSRYPDGNTAATSTTAAYWRETMQKIVNANVSFIASCGDQVDASGGNETEYTNFFAPPGLRNLPFAPVSGNHDNHIHYNYHYNWPNAQTFAAETSATVEKRNYFYLYNNVLFVVLNTAPSPADGAAGPHIDRFKQTIQAAKTAHAGKYEWIIVQHHKSTASVAVHLADRDIQYYVEAGFERIMSEEGVDFVLAGHDHVYARSYPLAGKDGGKVSVPDKTKDGNTVNNAGNPIYLTFTTGSGLKYYPVAADKTFPYLDSSGTKLYVTNNTVYPYLGEVTNANGDASTLKGSQDWLAGGLPVSNVAYVQPWIPSYTVCEVNGRSITFSTYAIASVSGNKNGAAANGEEPYSFTENVPYDTVTVTK
ncbi:MAG: metallophosphoesterase family protein [Treponema sp.]|nr:metallophosphoesterase family protein [Treponema sp.]